MDSPAPPPGLPQSASDRRIRCPMCRRLVAPEHLESVRDIPEPEGVPAWPAAEVCGDCVSRATIPLIAAAARLSREHAAKADFAPVIRLRNMKLDACTWVLDPTARLTDEKRAEWMAYRKALNDMPIGYKTPAGAMKALNALQPPG